MAPIVKSTVYSMEHCRSGCHKLQVFAEMIHCCITAFLSCVSNWFQHKTWMLQGWLRSTTLVSGEMAWRHLGTAEIHILNSSCPWSKTLIEKQGSFWRVLIREQSLMAEKNIPLESRLNAAFRRKCAISSRHDGGAQTRQDDVRNLTFLVSK